MRTVDYPEQIKALIAQLKRLPGIGAKSAERIAIWMLQNPGAQSRLLGDAIGRAVTEIVLCPECGFFSGGGEADSCPVCSDHARETRTMCVVEQPTDILALERTGVYRGQYHCLGGKLAPLDNVAPEDLRIERLLERLRPGDFREVILAVGADVEGEATAHYIADLLGDLPLEVTRLAQGLPVGGGLESADDLTLYRALDGRTVLEGHRPR